MRCPACATADLVPTVDLGDVPALCGVTWPDPQGATRSPSGRLRLEHCPVCAHVVNVDFDPAAIEYDGTYDNNLHYSGTFRRYAAELAQRLAATYDLAGKHVLELGCGKGDFLVELSRAAGCRATGYDASYDGRHDEPGVEFVRGFLDLDAGSLPYDFVVTRHVLEHLDDPYAFLVALARTAEGREVLGYFEVPDATYDFGTAGWDCIYPHVSYFNARSLRRMVERAGFDVLTTGTSFNDQFLYVEVAAGSARATDHRADAVHNDTDLVDRQIFVLDSFASRYATTVADWRDRLANLAETGARPVLWGAGARGVAFLNAVDRDRHLAAVVDLNPGKWGTYLPRTGHQVSDPASLADLRPETVVITNPAYEGEIRSHLASLGVDAAVVCA